MQFFFGKMADYFYNFRFRSLVGRRREGSCLLWAIGASSEYLANKSPLYSLVYSLWRHENIFSNLGHLKIQNPNADTEERRRESFSSRCWCDDFSIQKDLRYLKYFVKVENFWEPRRIKEGKYPPFILSTPNSKILTQMLFWEEGRRESSASSYWCFDKLPFSSNPPLQCTHILWKSDRPIYNIHRRVTYSIWWVPTRRHFHGFLGCMQLPAFFVVARPSTILLLLRGQLWFYCQ